MNAPMQEEKHYVPGSHGGQMYLNRLRQKDGGPVVMMVHGFGSNSEVFCKNERGLAHYLAQFGFDVYVADLMSRGRSRPHLSRTSQYHINDIIDQDIPALVQTIERTSHQPVTYVVCEGLGSAWYLTALSNHPEWIENLKGLVHFGGYRYRETSNSILLKIRWFFARLVCLFSRIMPLKFFGLGLNDESKTLFQDYVQLTEGSWTNSEGKNVATALREFMLPKSLYFSALKDHLASQSDVRYLIQELGVHHARLIHLGRKGGSLRNYRHFSMLMHDDAVVDHFPMVLDWLDDASAK